MINTYYMSDGNRLVSEYGFSLLLSTQWIEMYDRELQQVLGLAALCRFVIHGSDNRSVHLPVCPVQFALYLKVCCALDSNKTRRLNIRRDFIERAKNYLDENSLHYGNLGLVAAHILIIIGSLPEGRFMESDSNTF